MNGRQSYNLHNFIAKVVDVLRRYAYAVSVGDNDNEYKLQYHLICHRCERPTSLLDLFLDFGTLVRSATVFFGSEMKVWEHRRSGVER